MKPRISEIGTVLKQAAQLKHELLLTTAKDIRMWTVQLRKVKSVYFAMNDLNLDVTRRYFIGHFWVPVDQLKRVDNALKQATQSTAGEYVVPYIINQVLPPTGSSMEVPTYFPTNDFTAGFQAIVEAFSVAKFV